MKGLKANTRSDAEILLQQLLDRIWDPLVYKNKHIKIHLYILVAFMFSLMFSEPGVAVL